MRPVTFSYPRPLFRSIDSDRSWSSQHSHKRLIDSDQELEVRIINLLYDQ